jgi:hypothetical protein
LVGTGIPATVEAEQGEVIGIHGVPPQIKQVAEGMVTNANWFIAWNFKNGGKPFYRLLGRDSRNHQLTADVWADGRPFRVKTYIGVAHLPEAVRTALKTKQPQFKPSDESLAACSVGVNDREVFHYRIEGTVPENKSLVVLVSPDGSGLQYESHQFDFQKVSFAEGGFSIALPGKPIEQSKDVGDGVIERTYIVESGDRTIAFFVSYLDIPHQAHEILTKPIAALQAYRDEKIRRELMISERQVAGSVPGIEAVYDVAENNSLIRVQFYISGWRIYQVMVISSPKDDNFIATADADRFFKSFTIVQTGSALARNYPNR